MKLQTIEEELLAGIWAKILRLPRVGVDDNFFELGGNSLTGTRLMGEIEEVFGIRLTLGALFEKPTVRQLVDLMKDRRLSDSGVEQESPMSSQERQERDIGFLRPAKVGSKIPLSMAQSDVWLQIQETNRTCSTPLVFRLDGLFDFKILERSMAEIVRRHEILRTNIVQENGSPVQIVRPYTTWELSVCSLEDLPENRKNGEVSRFIEAEAQRSYDLAGESLMRIVLLRLDRLTHLLVLNLCEIICDLFSVHLLFRELTTLYNAWSKGLPSPLPELTIQYGDFAYWQRERLTEKVLEAELVYWKRVLGGTLPRLPWRPKDVPSPVQYYEDYVSVLIPDELTNRLRLLSRRVGVTLYMTMLASFKTMLVHLTGQTDVLVGSTVSGRRHSKTAGLIGCFVNMVAIRTGISRDLSFKDVLLKVRAVTLEASARQDWPWGLLLRKLQPELHLREESPVQIIFNYIARTPGTGFLLAEDRSLGSAPLTPAWFRDNWLAVVPIVLIVDEEECNLRVDLCYQRGLFSKEESASLLQRFSGLLEQIVAVPEKPVGSYTM